MNIENLKSKRKQIERLLFGREHKPNMTSILIHKLTLLDLKIEKLERGTNE